MTAIYRFISEHFDSNFIVLFRQTVMFQANGTKKIVPVIFCTRPLPDQLLFAEKTITGMFFLHLL